MSRVPFWLVVLFALILCVTGGLTLLHRAGLIGGNNVKLAENQALPPETGLIVAGIERRNPGILIVEGRTQPEARVSVFRNGEKLIAETADKTGAFSLPFRLPDAAGKGWQLLTIQSGEHKTMPLLLGPARKGDTAMLALLQTPAGHWQPLVPPEALAIATLNESANGDWQLSGQHPSGSALLMHIYSDDMLVATQTADTAQFTITLPKARRPQASLRIDAYDAATLAPVVRLALKLPLDSQFERVSVADQSLWVWRDAAAQQGDAAENLPGQIIPVAIATPAKAD